jgi:hypothetical protein
LLIASAILLGYFAWQSAGSRNLGLATATLVGAAWLFGVQLAFELRPAETIDLMTAEFTIDRAKPEIRQWNYSVEQSSRRRHEMDASRKFADAHAGQFDGDGTKLAKDLAAFSLLAYLGVEQFDWQLKRTQFVGQVSGTLTLTGPGSRPDECTPITKNQLRTMLREAGNLFAEGGAALREQYLCLPPRSSFQITADEVTFANPFCEISFTLEPSGGASYVKPGTHGLEAPQLANGKPQFETRAVNVRAVVRYAAVRAQHRDMPKYQEWSKQLIAGARRWFMGNGGLG